MGLGHSMIKHGTLWLESFWAISTVPRLKSYHVSTDRQFWYGTGFGMEVVGPLIPGFFIKSFLFFHYYQYVPGEFN